MTIDEQLETHLNPGLIELRYSGQLFTTVDIWVVAFSESRLEFLQLLLGEGGAVSSPGRCGRTRGRRPARVGCPRRRTAAGQRRLARVRHAAAIVAQTRLHFQLLEGAVYRTGNCNQKRNQSRIEMIN